LGTVGGLAVTAVLASVFQGVAELTGFASEEASYLLASGARVNLRGLMLGGVIIGALGAIDDITVTQTSAINELHRANPSIGRFQLMRAGMRIGRDHVASTVNTLALAYVGASMPVLLLFVLSNQSLGTVANGEVVATEIFRTLVGSIGLIASVPVTTLLATRFLARGDAKALTSDERNRVAVEP
ncbi:MAG: YibE/F family protein, partial [Actinomycetota bacterium]|nr:YibE/F family protein [Actinomycetota bacterium]